MKVQNEVFVGVDVSKQWLDVNSGNAFRVSNDAKGIRRLLTRLAGCQVKLVVVESTGGYENLLIEALWDADVPVSHVNPRKTKAFAVAIGITAKTDKIDASVLRLYAEKGSPRVTKAPPMAVRKLKPLVDRRLQLVTMMTAEKNRRTSPLADKTVKDSIKMLLTVLRRQLKDIDEKIFAIIRTNEELRKKAEVVQNELGVGPALTMMILADLPELGTLSRGQVAALVGVAPYNSQSGNKDGKRRPSGGRTALRSTLYMATLSAVRYNKKLKEFYKGLLRRGKIKMVAHVAAMRRFIVYLNAIMRVHLQASAIGSIAAT